MMTAERFAATFDVPRGTIDRLIRYDALLRDWQERMNLVGPATLPTIWDRHFADSAQLSRLVEPGLSWLDIGAGGGFPGLVLAAMDWGQFTLVESVQKKCRFLEAVVEELRLSASVSIVCARIEALPTLGVDVATARAAAPLDTLFEWSIRHVRPGGRFIFPKGRSFAEELEAAERRFAFDHDLIESLTDPEARIILATNLARLHRKARE
jgi:16S rRNA (guanine527-N7)-methyltransferase